MHIFYVCILFMYPMYVFYVCIRCMYSMCVFYVCILCVYAMDSQSIRRGLSGRKNSNVPCRSRKCSGPPPRDPPPQIVTHLFFGAKLLFFKSARLFRCPWGRRPSGPRVFWLLWNIEIINLEHEIYDIGTEILYETCFGHNSTQNAPKSMIPVRVCTDFCVDSESAIKTRF